jgi:hypothetical protein
MVGQGDKLGLDRLNLGQMGLKLARGEFAELIARCERGLSFRHTVESPGILTDRCRLAAGDSLGFDFPDGHDATGRPIHCGVHPGHATSSPQIAARMTSP